MANYNNLTIGQVLYEVSRSTSGNYSVREYKVISKLEDGRIEAEFQLTDTVREIKYLSKSRIRGLKVRYPKIESGKLLLYYKLTWTGVEG